MNKKPEEMTFAEFFVEMQKEGVDSKEIEDVKNWMLDTLRRKGLTDEQINEMKMDKVRELTPNIRP